MSSWALPDEVFTFLKHRLIASSAVLELGSGAGTRKLVQLFGRVHTVEHDALYLNQAEGAQYIHAQIEDGWYSARTLRERLPDRYDCLVVDGPPGVIGRAGLLRHLDLFQPVPTVVDDVHRRPEHDLAVSLARAWKMDLSIHYLRSGRAFAAIGWPNF